MFHDRFNTWLSAIQDPQAFYHDVIEYAIENESYDRLATWKYERVHEINDS